ncbi:hypothetical protein CYFUS_001249 [Cystobacter fuscus]|uniref:Uncharacterized protein n=1 Tax=Cystobacter fuscus TaxID=43 RepID=A0A250IVR2_9BACT|nr:hypothetical protein [Cystobacter fuscus]ATB35835.1 hypothetical protein CYFUS_001249 [Cystobacter fuscus]
MDRLRAAEVYVAVVEAGSFSAAARALVMNSGALRGLPTPCTQANARSNKTKPFRKDDRPAGI